MFSFEHTAWKRIIAKSQFNFFLFFGRYQACADIRRSESSVEELRCLGSWKEGSTHYFLGKTDGS